MPNISRDFNGLVDLKLHTRIVNAKEQNHVQP